MRKVNNFFQDLNLFFVPIFTDDNHYPTRDSDIVKSTYNALIIKILNTKNCYDFEKKNARTQFLDPDTSLMTCNVSTLKEENLFKPTLG